jgi:hypothetical protein
MTASRLSLTKLAIVAHLVKLKFFVCAFLHLQRTILRAELSLGA